MRVTKFLLLASLLAVMCSGCRYDCDSLCTDAAQCDDFKPSDGETCTTECTKLNGIAEEQGCASEYDSWLSCVGGADDICDQTGVEAACMKEVTAFGLCAGDALR